MNHQFRHELNRRQWLQTLSGQGLAAALMTRGGDAACGADTLSAGDARVCVTGHDHNRPAPFAGLGDFIGWAKAIDRMPNGDLLLSHSAGYWHASFASPRNIEPELRQRYKAMGWPVDYEAPTGGRTMACRSRDNGKSWSKPTTIIDHPLDDCPNALFTCRDKTVLCFINVQASWYGYSKAPKPFARDIDGLNTKQMVLRSHDNGHTWSEPIWIEPPEGATYERAHGRPISMDNGSILWPTYCNSPNGLFGAIHRSDDSGRTWQTHSVIRRKANLAVDEPAIVQLNNGQLLMVTRPDGAVLISADRGLTWAEQSTKLVPRPKFKAPQLFVLGDGAVVAVATWSTLRVWISKDHGRTWTKDLPLDNSTYGYPGGVLLEDESILVSYCESGQAPNRVYVVRFALNDRRDGIVRLPIG